jgi:hypothetical protein
MQGVIKNFSRETLMLIYFLGVKMQNILVLNKL